MRKFLSVCIFICSLFFAFWHSATLVSAATSACGAFVPNGSCTPQTISVNGSPTKTPCAVSGLSCQEGAGYTGWTCPVNGTSNTSVWTPIATTKCMAACPTGLDCSTSSPYGSFQCSNNGNNVSCCPSGTYKSSDNKCLPLCGRGLSCANVVLGGTQCIQAKGSPSGMCCPTGSSNVNGVCTSYSAYCGQNTVTAAACKGQAVGTKTSAGCICNAQGNFYAYNDPLKQKLYTCSCDATALAPPSSGSPTTPSSCTAPGACFTVGSSYNGTTVNNCGSVGRVDAGQTCSSGQICCKLPDGNSGPSSTPQPRACGEACTKTSDCRNPSTGGFPVECRNGKCQLPLTGAYACPEGKSEGSICTCSAKQQCGQPCGPAAGGKLCNPGNICGFVTPSNACKVNGVDQTAKQFCLPVNPNNGYSLKRCDTTPAINYIAADSLAKPDGTQTSMTAADVANACAAVCGDKVTAPGEECDWGSDNGKPGSLCTSSCKIRAACGDTCSSQSQCNKHLVTLRCEPGAGRPYCGLDAIKENGVIFEQTDSRFVKPGMWRVSSTAALSGGSEVYDHENGGTISFWTTARSVIVIQTKATNRGAFSVLIDGKLQPTKIDQYNSTTLYKQEAVIDLRGSSSPEYVCQSNICRLQSDPTNTTCGITATPIPTPQTLACDLTTTFTTTGNAAALKYGDMVTFSVSPVLAQNVPSGTTIRYEGEAVAYRGNDMVKKAALTPINSTASQFMPMKVESGNAIYYARFRYCLLSGSEERCSAWGSWTAPNNGVGTPIPTSVPEILPTATPVATAQTCATPPVCPPGSSLIYGDPRAGGCPAYQCTPVGTSSPTPTVGASRTVKFVNKIPTSTRTSLVVDYIKEGTTVFQDNSSRLTYTGTWAVGTDSGPSGGTYKATKVNGSSMTFTTTQSSIILRTYRYVTRGDIEVYVDGVLKNTITGLNVGQGWVDIPIALQ